MKIVIFFILIICVCDVCRSEQNDENCLFEFPLSIEMLQEKYRCVSQKLLIKTINPIDFVQKMNERAKLGDECQTIANITSFPDFINNCYCFIVEHKYSTSQLADTLSNLLFEVNPHLSTFFEPIGNDSNVSLSYPPVDCSKCDRGMGKTINILYTNLKMLSVINKESFDYNIFMHSIIILQ